MESRITPMATVLYYLQHEGIYRINSLVFLADNLLAVGHCYAGVVPAYLAYPSALQDCWINY